MFDNVWQLAGTGLCVLCRAEYTWQAVKSKQGKGAHGKLSICRMLTTPGLIMLTIPAEWVWLAPYFTATWSCKLAADLGTVNLVSGTVYLLETGLCSKLSPPVYIGLIGFLQGHHLAKASLLLQEGVYCASPGCDSTQVSHRAVTWLRTLGSVGCPRVYQACHPRWLCRFVNK